MTHYDQVTETYNPMTRPPSVLLNDCSNARGFQHQIKNLMAMPGMVKLDDIAITAMGQHDDYPDTWIVNYRFMGSTSLNCMHFPIAILERVYRTWFKMYYDKERDQTNVQVYDEKAPTRKTFNNHEMNTLKLFAKNNDFKVIFVARDNPATGQSDWGGRSPIQHAYFTGNMWE
jgi:hypothetical protein